MATSGHAQASSVVRKGLGRGMESTNDVAIEAVPVDDENREVDWELRSLGGGDFTLDPYPFRRDPLEFAILARRIPKARYTEDADLQKTLAAAPFFNMKFRLRSGAAKEKSSIARA